MSKQSLRSKKFCSVRNINAIENSLVLDKVNIGNTTSQYVYFNNNSNCISLEEVRDYSLLTKPFSLNTIRIGYQSGIDYSRKSSIIIGKQCCYQNFTTAPTSATSSISIGTEAGRILQYEASMAIGKEAGRISQQGFAIGYKAGSNSQRYNSIALGYLAGCNKLSNSSIAIGNMVGINDTQLNTTAIGNNIGFTFSEENSVAIGNNIENPPKNSISIGNNLYYGNYLIPGNYSNSICIGNNYNTVNCNSVPNFQIINIGTDNFLNGTSSFTTVIGNNNGHNTSVDNYLGHSSIVIGSYNGPVISNNTIVIGNHNGNKTDIGTNNILIGNGIGGTEDSNNLFIMNSYGCDIAGGSFTTIISGSIQSSNVPGVLYGALFYNEVTSEVVWSTHGGPPV